MVFEFLTNCFIKLGKLRHDALGLSLLMAQVFVVLGVELGVVASLLRQNLVFRVESRVFVLYLENELLQTVSMRCFNLPR